jgi:hypothetical protein
MKQFPSRSTWDAFEASPLCAWLLARVGLSGDYPLPLASLRKDRGITQRLLADRIGCLFQQL